MTDYTMKIGGGYRGPSSTLKGFTREIVEGVTRAEQDIAELRKREGELIVQTVKQKQWLNDLRNRDDPLWEQRQAIWLERHVELAEVGERCNGLLDSLEVEIRFLEGDEKEEALKRLLQWIEPPFLIAFFMVMLGVM